MPDDLTNVPIDDVIHDDRGERFRDAHSRLAQRDKDQVLLDTWGSSAVWINRALIAIAVASFAFGAWSKSAWPFIALFASVAFFWMARIREFRRLEPAALVGTGRCGACGHSLHELSPKADGCTICPECGAAWRITHK